jgi:hypothetical protein
MSRKQSRKQAVTPPNPKDYWINFLKAQGLIGAVPEYSPTETPLVEGETEALVDPMFSKFLHYAGQYGAPPSIAEFQKLMTNDKLYYLKAYKTWLEKIKERKIKPENL